MDFGKKKFFLKLIYYLISWNFWSGLFFFNFGPLCSKLLFCKCFSCVVFGQGTDLATFTLLFRSFWWVQRRKRRHDHQKWKQFHCLVLRRRCTSTNYHTKQKLKKTWAFVTATQIQVSNQRIMNRNFFSVLSYQKEKPRDI